MKKIRFLSFMMIFLCVTSTFLLTGCGDKTLPSAKITRDDARTGGSLSFVYDQKERQIFIGGQNEVVQFSQADENRNLVAGCRVGLKVTAPDEKLNLDSAKLEMNGVTYESDDFLESENGQKQRFFNLFPLVSKDDDEMKFSVTWADGTKKQTYRVQIVDGTKFMDADGNVQ